MNFTGTNCSCGTNDVGTFQQCNQVVQTCNVEEIPHYTNYHTHVVNNLVKKHINIPTYSSSSENVVINEYVEGQPIYYNQLMYNQNVFPYQQPYMYNTNQYQGNVGTEGFQQQMPYQGYIVPNFMNPYSNM